MSSSRPKDETTVHPAARAIGSITTGALEAGLMFPFDKYKNLRQLGETVTLRQAFSYRGVTPYVIHKIGSRYLVLGAVQPFFLNKIRSAGFYSKSENKLGRSNAKTLAATFAGGMSGVAEVSLNPIDRWKLLCQKKNLTARGAFYVMQQEGFLTQYAGWKETVKRNSLGASMTFFGKFLTYDLLGLEDHTNPTFLQSFTSSMTGSTFRILISHLPDVAKNRAQMDPGNTMSITKRLAEVVKKEGIGSLYAGAAPKLTAAAVKFGIVLTACDMLTREINKLSIFKVENKPASENKASTPKLG